MKHTYRLNQILVTLALGSTLLVVPGCSDDTAVVIEPGATTEASAKEIPGNHSPNDLNPITAQRWIDDVNLGRSVSAGGDVPPAARADRFGRGESIYLSMEVVDAPAGTKVLVQVLNAETEKSLWSSEQVVKAGSSHMNFGLAADKLATGSYTATVNVGDERVARRSFVIG